MKTKWTTEELNKWRLVMDKNADNAVSSIYHSAQSQILRNALAKIASNDSKEMKEHFPELEESKPLFDLIEMELNQIFTETDLEMFQMAREIWKDKGIYFIFVLFFRALPYTYAAEKPANVLRLTQLLITHPTRRIFETAQFIFDVMEMNWWTPEKRGTITALKVRIMHAAMRYMLLNHEAAQDWDANEWGMPISQEDLIATNQVFSLEFIKGMSMMNKGLTDKEQAAWFHTWKVIGRIMGIEEQLLSANIEEAWDLQTSIYKHLFIYKNHNSGIILAQSLVEELKKFMMPEKLVLIMMRKMMHDDLFPEVFSELLEPNYGKDHPELFDKTEDDGSRERAIHKNFINELSNFHLNVKEHHLNEQAQATSGKEFLISHLDKFEGLLNKAKDELKETVEHVENDAFNRMHFFSNDTIEVVGKILMYKLSHYFREGKQAGFRIDADLKEHWDLNN